MITTHRRRTPISIWRGIKHRGRRLERVGHRRFLTYPKRVSCPVCGWSGPVLGTSHNPRRPNRICPECRSSERYRALELMLTARGAAPIGARLLEVAPIATVQPTAERLGYQYSSVDLRSARAQIHGDLCNLPFPDHSFDIAICFHVLEHIPTDILAVRELARVVGEHGEAIVVVPREDNRPTTFEDPDADPAEYERLYGQSDHVRIYGADIASRWDHPDLLVTVQRWEDVFAAEDYRQGALDGDDDRFWIIRARETEPRPANT